MRAATVSEQIRANPDLIPSLPDVVAQALQLVDKPDVGPNDFEELLSRDPPLVATMLKMANSPVYGFSHEKETVRDAIIGMGLNGLRGMLLGTTLKRFLGRQFSCYGKDPKALWQHAMAVATAAKVITKQLPAAPDHAEEMYVAGLLHDLGKLLLAPHLTRMGEDLTQSTEAVHIVEERLLGIDHQEAGGMVAEKWNMKPMVRAVIMHHHYKGCPSQYRHAVAVVRLADQCATDNGHGAGTLEPASAFLSEDLEAIGLKPPEWEELAATVVEATQVVLGGP